MNKNEKYSIRKYDSIAAIYDDSFDGQFTAKFKQAMLAFCTVSDGDRVLDVGCGNGRLIHDISRKASIHAYGIDIATNMIQVCQQQYPDIAFTDTNGEALPFDDDSFDMVIMCCVLHHLHDPQQFFTEARRVLAEGGVLVVGEPSYPLVIRKLADWIVSPLLKAGDNRLFSHKRLVRLFINNGFHIVESVDRAYQQIVKGRVGEE